MADNADGPLDPPLDYTAGERDGIDWIAERSGHFWRTIWEAPENAALRDARSDRNILCPGDIIHVPARREKEERGATDLIHRFKRLGVPLFIRFRALEPDGGPISDAPYLLTVGRRAYQGRTDADGYLECYIAPTARTAVLSVDVPTPEGENAQETETLEWHIGLGGLRPADTIAGAQARMRNLGKYSGASDGEANPAFSDALKRFQEANALEPTGELDEATADVLREAHGN